MNENAMPKITMLLTNPFLPDPRPLKEAMYLTSLGFEVEILALDFRNIRRDQPVQQIDGITIRRVFTSPPEVCDDPSSWEPITKLLYSIPFFWHFENLRHQFKFIRWIKQYLKQNPTDYLHGHDLSGAWIGLRVQKATRVKDGRQQGSCGAPIIFDMHEDYETPTRQKARFRHLIRLFVHHVQNHCAAIICVHLPQLKQMTQRSINKSFYLPNWPPAAYLHRVDYQPGDKLRLVYAGHILLETVKLHENIFEATKDLPVEITVHGHGFGYEALSSIAARYPHVTLTGGFDFRSDFDRIFSNADLIYILYDYQNFGGRWNVGTKLYESLCAGIPYMVQEHTAMGDFAVSAGVGVVVDTYDSAAIRTVISDLAQDRTLLDGMRERIAENDFNSIFVWEKAVADLRCIYGDPQQPGVVFEPRIPLTDVDVDKGTVVPIFKDS